MAIRYTFGFTLGAVATVLLLYIMQEVISSDKSPLNDAPLADKIEFVRLIEDQEPRIGPVLPEPPPPPEEMPPKLEWPEDTVDEDGVGVPFDPPDSVIVEPTRDGGFHDGEYLPIVQVEPVYPRRAQQRGIEGHVVMQLTVTPNGTVTDVVVIESEPKGVFEKAAVDAALKNKYKPRIVGGQPITVTGVRYRITFELEK